MLVLEDGVDVLEVPSLASDADAVNRSTSFSKRHPKQPLTTTQLLPVQSRIFSSNDQLFRRTIAEFCSASASVDMTCISSKSYCFESAPVEPFVAVETSPLHSGQH